MSVTLDTPLAKIIGDRSQKAFHKAFGYESVGDLLGHYPRRYATRGELTSIAEIPIGEQATLVAEVVSVSTRPMRQKRGSVLEVVITDGTGGVTLTFFNQAWRQKDLSPGVRGIFAGKIGLYRNSRQLAHPDYELFVDVEPSEEAREDWAKKPIPLYPATSTLASWQIAKAIGVVLDVLELKDEPVPDTIREAEGILGHYESLVHIHRPVEAAGWASAQKSLRFQEALTLQCALVARRQRQRQVAGVTRKPGEDTNAFLASLPFELTEDQVTVVNQIHEDMAAPHPMTRLVQGEVGSGKTVVAACAMVTVSQSGGQTALLAPTEVLANQHFRSLMRTLGPDASARLNPVLLTGSLPAAAKKKALLAAASGASHLIVGTHALLGDAVQFADLGLVVIDEQHRFGVDQREVLRQKGEHPHLLVLTATPIPRTVAMTVFGDLDVSTIATMPQGRSPISSHVVALADHPGWYSRVWQRVAEEVRAGRQAFVVAPAITAAVVEEDTDIEDESEELAKKPLSTVEETLPLLRGLSELSGMRIEALHGRMPSAEKDDVMSAFAAGDIDVLIATTVIEVGIDVPNASVMVILDADRFGVSQLHQLRGRVGRGEYGGTCLLVSYAETGTNARERVEVVASTLDGFELAAKDLELRSEGDVLGVRQSGVRSRLKLLRVTRDGDVIDAARTYAEALVEKDPGLVDYPGLRAEIGRRLDDGSEEYLEKT
ncbi:MAG: ATP-dependent DNA helicase RecG [Pontimonas sp.]|mgnify:FL=1